MGKQVSKDKKVSENEVRNEIVQAIVAKDLKKFQKYFEVLRDVILLTDSIYNYQIFKIQSQNLTVPEYCILTGSWEIFKHLHENDYCSIVKIEEKFFKLNTSTLTIMATMDYYDLLVYYLPLYLSNSIRFHRTTSFLTFDNFSVTENESTYTPLMIACDKGFTHIVKYFFDFFGNNPKYPYFDINYQDENTQENCALISCRNCDFKMMKFLHEYCNADFQTFNRYGENAIQIVCIHAKDSENVDIVVLLSFLIEVLNVDFTYNYEETLLLCNSFNASKYIEEKLKQKGISASKIEIEKKNVVGGRTVREISQLKLSAISNKFM